MSCVAVVLPIMETDSELFSDVISRRLVVCKWVVLMMMRLKKLKKASPQMFNTLMPIGFKERYRKHLRKLTLSQKLAKDVLTILAEGDEICIVLLLCTFQILNCFSLLICSNICFRKELMLPVQNI